MQKCETCKWWDRKAPGHTYADCHRMPPQFSFSVDVRERDNYGREKTTLQVTRFPNGQWPNTAHDDFCGEHQPS